MTRAAWMLLAAALLLAIVDWVGCATGRMRLRQAGKPGALLLLITAALVLHPASGLERNLFVVALILCLAGDVLLLLPDGCFPVALASFLLGQLAYSAAFIAAGVDWRHLAVIGALVAAASTLLGGRILGAARERGAVPPAAILAYLVAISAMVALAGGSPRPPALVGASLFYLSDAMIAWNRFVRPLRAARVPIMVTYHLGQGLLVLSLV